MSLRLTPLPLHRLLLSLLALACLWVGVVVSLTTIRLPYTGLQVDKTGLVVEVYSDSPNRSVVQVGDQIRWVSRRPFMDANFQGGFIGATVPYLIAREGRLQEIQIRLAVATPTEMLRRLIDLVTGWLFWLLGVLIFVRRPDSSLAQLFLLLCLAGDAALLPMELSEARIAWASHLNKLGILLAPAAFVHLHTLFPVPLRGRWQQVSRGLYLIGGGLYLCYLLRGIYTIALQPWFDILVLASDLYLVAGLGSGLLLLGRAWRTESGHIQRQIRFVGLGTALAIGTLLVVIVSSALNDGASSATYKLGILSLVLIPLSYAYALYKEDLLASDVALQRFLVHLFVGILTCLAYLTIIYAASSLLPESARLHAVGGVAAIALVILVLPTRRFLEYAISKFLYGAANSYLQLSSEVGEKLGAHLDTQVVVEALTQIIPPALRVQYAGVGVIQDGMLRWVGGNLTIDAQPSLLPEPLHQQLIQGRLVPLSQEGSQGLGILTPVRWLVPLQVARDLQGVWAIGPQAKDRTFHLFDQLLLHIAARIAALALKVIAQMEDLRAQLTIIERQQNELTLAYHYLATAQEAERGQIAADLHDDLLQEVYHLQVRLQLLLEEQGAEGVGRALTELDACTTSIISRIRGMCDTLHSSVDAVGLALSLYSLAARMSERYGFQVRLNVPPHQRWPWVIERAILGVAQEALNNVGKHAQAQQVTLLLHHTADMLELTIQDDGRGFDSEQARQDRFGMVGMHARITALSGALTISSSPGHGTTVHAAIPLQ